MPMKPPESDADKLRTIAIWFDRYDASRGVSGDTEIQDDLNRIAEDLDAFDRGTNGYSPIPSALKTGKVISK